MNKATLVSQNFWKKESKLSKTLATTSVQNKYPEQSQAVLKGDNQAHNDILGGISEHSHKVYIGNLPRTATAEQLVIIFSQFGNVKHACIGNENSKNPYRFAFLEFASLAGRSAALSARKIVIETRKAIIKPYTSRFDQVDQRQNSAKSSLTQKKGDKLNGGTAKLVERASIIKWIFSSGCNGLSRQEVISRSRMIDSQKRNKAQEQTEGQGSKNSSSWLRQNRQRDQEQGASDNVGHTILEDNFRLNAIQQNK